MVCRAPSAAPVTVLCTARVQPHHVDSVRSCGRGVEVRAVRREEVEPHLPEADILVTWAVPDAWVARAARLRWVHVTSAGVDHLLGGALWRSEVLITNSRGVHATPMAEHVLGWLLMFARNLHVHLEHQRHRRWQREEGGQLSASTVGVVGLGAVGKEVARLCKACGARVLGLRRRPEPVPFVDRVVGPEGLRELLESSDYVVLALPLVPSTRGLVGREQLRWMKPDAVLVNVGRGALVDEAALVEALREGRLRGAALDTFTCEPLPPESPLWELPNVLLSPHVAGSFRGYMDRVVELFCDNLRRYLAGEPLRNVVDREAGY
ncbi:MAG: D-2-hydroxyacid dehydrogenase [Armatimonadota bacterium]|nr:D-2-hydroxyacid dehydrogenase [Armatimonadota bacterium]MDW8155201.1 D-2-hydroxyacid dehydrogenase [Armatimonadota bacterium]